MYLRALGSAPDRRISLTSRFCCSSQPCQASLDTLSKMRLPSSPPNGGAARPSASRLSFTQWTILGMTEFSWRRETARVGAAQDDFRLARFSGLGQTGGSDRLEED